MADRRLTLTPLEKLRTIINEARIACGGTDSSPDVTDKMLTRPYLRRLSKEKCQTLVLRAGMNHFVRAFLGHGKDGKGTTPEQLAFWPETTRGLVKEIGRAAVYVPSRAEFIPLEPAAITPFETREAGHYLIKHGQDCIRAGTQLLRLSRMSW